MRKYVHWSGERYKERNQAQERNAIEALSQLEDTERPILQILDIGCGTGNITQLLARKFLNARIIGIDASESMIQVAQENFPAREYPMLTFEIADISTYVSDQKFDLVVSFNCLHWVPNLVDVLSRNICPLLNENATFLFMIYPRAAGLWDAIDKVALTTRWKKFFPDYVSPYQSYLPDEIDQMLKNNAFGQSRTNITPKKTNYPDGPEGLGRYLYGFLPILDIFPEDYIKREFINDVLREYTANVPVNRDGSLDFEFVQLNAISTFQPQMDHFVAASHKDNEHGAFEKKKDSTSNLQGNIMRNHPPVFYSTRRRNIVFIGLLGSGKSTASQTLLQKLQQKNPTANLVSTDERILEVIRDRANPIILSFQKAQGIDIDPSVSESDSPTATFITLYGEPVFRQLEAQIVLSMVANAKENIYFDLGGKTPILEGVAHALKRQGVIFVFLNVSHETILAHLSKNNAWSTRGIYKIAEESGSGWQQLALEHREDRIPKYSAVADITIEADNKTPEMIIDETLVACANKFEFNPLALPINAPHCLSPSLFHHPANGENNIALVKHILNVWWCKRSKEELRPLVSEQATIKSPIDEYISRGQGDIVADMFLIMEHWLHALPNNTCTWSSATEVKPGTVVIEWSSVATHTGADFCGIKSNNVEFEYVGKTTYTIDDGKLVGYNAEVNMELILERLSTKSAQLTV
ncbi:MAG: hypothetical protein COY58_04180 [Gammaproteobacteria bacterium CG_4_10_14_0_8_um_filter_38_16]|nr:MAG: hypothetical protein COY58_04180 [Gammaproteobacteria bacterium CG_4_10_14_0_8_um_filter_38_16]PJA02699.1 MAG: hypothetical protein COX72_09000 [Gammaproteobacteria bacterium CG_4_10_14_0_2_um_filter_38_22]PJB09627.1 MAG: hypothetical protein CO120_09085 [Gammaproteobacteria bacterium CG_4_9_14_3_um_filter_38_9]